MRVWLAGLNHRTAPVAVREKLAFVDAEVPDALAGLRACPGVSEAMILSTCNRVELTLAADDAVDGGALLADYLRHSRRVDAGWLDPHLYTYAGRDAIRHLFRVAASLDSMIVGEPQILGQLKAAYGHARECGTLGGVLDAAVSRAFNVAAPVRTETDIGSSAVSISSAAVELAREIFGNLKGRKVMLVGAGKMSELAARHLYRSGASILVTNRTEARALDLARVVHGSVVPYDAYRQHLKDID
ncbi:MAG TPA: glutamyl-tRNA reductase, partial [Bryobacteraceae bacterium]|nr:glutamyl-tRNA reductase [Bryobacteraceae bacterium]